MQRRDFITLSAVSALWLMSGCGGGSSNSTPIPPNDEDTTRRALAIPPLLDPIPVGGVKNFDLSIAESTHQFFAGVDTRTYGVSASYLGPTLLMRRGESVSINYTNNLAEPTTMHGHGMHVPASMDGGPHQIINPNTTWSARYQVSQKASTNWYHPHLMGKTADHVYMGLAGMIIVEDSESASLDLPRRYGVDDIPIVAQDKVFNANYQIDYSPSNMEIRQGYLGDTFLVNGVIDPYFDAEAKELRLRLLNGSNARVYQFAFSDGRVFHQIATDNSFLPSPVALNSVVLSPGERAEIVVDLSSDFGNSIRFIDLASGANQLTININKEATASSALPAILTDSLVMPNISEAVRRRSFVLGMSRMSMTINGKSMDMNRIDEVVPLGDLELWEITNSMNLNHNFHIHATHFTIVERDGSASNVASNERGYKDGLYMPPNSSAKVLVRMSDYRDSSTPYMYHCHFLEHEDDGMMGQFVVS